MWSQLKQIQMCMGSFHPFEIVVRGSQTQLQVRDNLDKITCDHDKRLKLNSNLIE